MNLTQPPVAIRAIVDAYIAQLDRAIRSLERMPEAGFISQDGSRIEFKIDWGTPETAARFRERDRIWIREIIGDISLAEQRLPSRGQE